MHAISLMQVFLVRCCFLKMDSCSMQGSISFGAMIYVDCAIIL